MGRQIRARGGRLSSLCERGARVGFYGDELQADGCARGDEVRGGADLVLVGLEMGSLHGEQMKDGPPCEASWLRVTDFVFLFFSPCGAGGEAVKALVWFWIIDETLVLTSILSVCRLNEVGTCQAMEQMMIMVMIVMITR